MLAIVMFFLIVASVTLFIINRNKESFYLLGMSISLAIMLSGVLIYIAKKGGTSQGLQQFFFLNFTIKRYFQYFLITLDRLGMIIAVGRYLFPLFLLLLAYHYSIIPWLKEKIWIKIIIFIPPVISLIIYHPYIFKLLTINNLELQSTINISMKIWIYLYIILALLLFINLIYKINARFIKRKYIIIFAYVLSICSMYLLYFTQDPGVVYQFYHPELMLNNRVFYMTSLVSIPTYLLIVLSTLFFGIVSFASITRYTVEIIKTNREEIILERKTEVINSSTTIFVHGIKNQLLSNRVLLKRIKKLYTEEELDLEKMKKYTDMLDMKNETLMERINILYNTVKDNRIYLKNISLNKLIDSLVKSYSQQYSKTNIKVNMESEMTILADETYLGEAINNLIMNAHDAIYETEKTEEGIIIISCYQEQNYTVIEVNDNGVGMAEKELKKVFDPYYTSKNTNSNWGMGLQYVRLITREHFGILKYESEVGIGTTFYLLLPNTKKSD